MHDVVKSLHDVLPEFVLANSHVGVHASSGQLFSNIHEAVLLVLLMLLIVMVSTIQLALNLAPSGSPRQALA